MITTKQIADSALSITKRRQNQGKNMRQVNLNFEQKELEEVSKILYAAGCDNNAVEIAIGYLSTWGLSYPFVDIYINVKDTEFTACYRKRAFEQGDSPAYVIGAVFNKQSKKFGFHS